MPAPVWLQTQESVELHTAKVGAHTHLVVEQHSRVATQFKSAALTDAGTVTIVSPSPGDAIVVTDVLYSAEKVNGGSMTIQFTDGSATVIMKSAIVTDAPVDGNTSLQGRALGWKDAQVDLVGVGTNLDCNATIFYYHVSGEGVLSFADWDALR